MHSTLLLRNKQHNPRAAAMAGCMCQEESKTSLKTDEEEVHRRLCGIWTQQ